ncbi:MAG: hypothetical protein QM630_05000 [Microbacterium sp.]
MRDADEIAELRALQQKAYGRDGGLTDAEAARLRELEEAALAPVAGDASSRAAVPERGALGPASRFLSEERSDETKGAQESRSDTKGAHGSWGLAAASVLLLVIGIGVGWALFAPRSHEAVVLTDDEAQRKLELEESGAFDEGTLRAVARDDDALVWFGAMDDGAQYCIVLDVDGQSQTGCSEPDQVDMLGLNVSLVLPPEDDSDPNDYGSGVNAYAAMSTTGEPMVAVLRWDYNSSALLQFDGEERERAQALIDEDGFQLAPTLIGYVHDQPVWLADRFTDSGSIETCVVVDAYEATVCAEESEARERGLHVVAIDTDAGSVDVSVEFTNGQMPYLVVTESDDQVVMRIPQGDSEE